MCTSSYRWPRRQTWYWARLCFSETKIGGLSLQSRPLWSIYFGVLLALTVFTFSWTFLYCELFESVTFFLLCFVHGGAFYCTCYDAFLFSFFFVCFLSYIYNKYPKHSGLLEEGARHLRMVIPCDLLCIVTLRIWIASLSIYSRWACAIEKLRS